jgi:hypothetical protein
MWNVKDLTGTLYTEHPTTLGHLVQTCYWLDNQVWTGMHNIIPYEYHNITGVLMIAIRQWEGAYSLNFALVTDPIDHYCSPLTSQDTDNPYQLAWRFMHSLDLQLHDAAVTYTYLAAEKTGKRAEQYAAIACQLWGYSRQLRVDAQRQRVQDHVQNTIYPNLR